MNKIALLTGAACIALSSTNVSAAETYPELYFGVSQTAFDSDANLDDSLGFDGGLSFPITPNFYLEAWAAFSDVESELTATEFDSRRLSLNGLYQFDATAYTKPFISLGLGDRRLETGSENISASSADIGVGVKHYFEDNNWLARLDVILAHDIDGRGFNDVISRFTVGYNFGENHESSYKAPAPVVKAPAPKPEPVAVAAPVDSDGDGVYDSEDKCADTAPRLKVGLDGCPIVLTEKVTIDLEVKFANNSAVVSDAYREEIKQVADFLAQYEGTVVEIKGYTDDRGAAEYNRALSDRRAKAVADVLVNDLGVNSSRVTANGYGEVDPIGDNNTAAGRAANRRVVAEVSAEKVTAVEK